MKNRQPPLRTASLQPIADALIVLVDCHVTLPAVTIHEDLSVYRMEIEWRERCYVFRSQHACFSRRQMCQITSLSAPEIQQTGTRTSF